MVLSAATKNIRRALRLITGISYTPLISGSKLKYSMDSSRQCLLIAPIAPVTTVVPFGDNSTLIPSNLPPKRDCG